MISKKVKKLMLEQITMEFQAAHDYKGMEICFLNKGLDGFAHWFNKQSQEEIEHAYRFINFLNDVNESIDTLDKLDAANVKFTNIRDVFEASLKQEQMVTQSIWKIIEAAEKDKDYASRQMLDWFISEQVEEENSVQKILDALDLVGDEHLGIYELDKKLGKRED